MADAFLPGLGEYPEAETFQCSGAELARLEQELKSQNRYIGDLKWGPGNADWSGTIYRERAPSDNSGLDMG